MKQKSEDKRSDSVCFRLHTDKHDYIQKWSKSMGINEGTLLTLWNTKLYLILKDMENMILESGRKLEDFQNITRDWLNCWRVEPMTLLLRERRILPELPQDFMHEIMELKVRLNLR